MPGVTELRGEFWINGSRSLSKTLRMDLGLNYEMSHLTVSGDATADRKLAFAKPSITLDWQPGGGWDSELILRRTVAQLNFFDFISVADLASNQVSGGNANLQPQRSWEGRLSAEHPLFGQGEARLELGYNLISLLQDRILTPEGFDAPGNIGTGRQAFADLTLDTPLDRFWKGLRVKLHGNVQRTRGRTRSRASCATLAAPFRAGSGTPTFGATLGGFPTALLSPTTHERPSSEPTSSIPAGIAASTPARSSNTGRPKNRC